MKTNTAGLNLIKEFEGLRLQPYNDSVNFCTVGYGHLIRRSPVTPQDLPITQEQADTYLVNDLEWAEAAVTRYVKVPLTENEFSALVAWTYNLGTGTLASSQVLTLINQGLLERAAAHMVLYDKAGGKTLPGLTRRRQAEVALFLKA
jgi:lysozyme